MAGGRRDEERVDRRKADRGEYSARLGVCQRRRAGARLHKWHGFCRPSLHMLDQETAPATRRGPLGGRILVVDDDRDVARLVGTVLEEAGHEVKAITDARQAMEAFNDFHPDLVTLDVLMPAVDGIRSEEHTSELQSPMY